MPLVNYKTTSHVRKSMVPYKQYMQLTTQQCEKIPDRMIATLRAIIQDLNTKRPKRDDTEATFTGLIYSGTRAKGQYLSPIRTKKNVMGSTREITHEHRKFLILISKVCHIRIMWEYVMAGDTAIKSICLVGSQPHIALASELLDYYLIQKDTYATYRRNQYHNLKRGKLDLSLFTDAKDYSSTFIKEFVLICNDTILKELENDRVNLMDPIQATLLEQWIPNSMKLDYRDYHYQSKPMFHNAISKKWHNKRFLPCEL